jgi:hypothetical protein
MDTIGKIQMVLNLRADTLDEDKRTVGKQIDALAADIARAASPNAMMTIARRAMDLAAEMSRIESAERIIADTRTAMR